MNKPTDQNPISVQVSMDMKQLTLENSLRKALAQSGVKKIDEVQEKFLVFDLSRSYWHDLGALLWLIALLHRLKIQGNDVQLVFPEPTESKGQKLWDTLIRWEFFNALSRCVDESANLLPPSQVPYLSRKSQYTKPHGCWDESGMDTVLHTLRILEITTILGRFKNTDELERQQSEFDKLKGPIIIGALSQKCGWEPTFTRTFMQRVVREGIRNSLLHGDGSFVNLAIRIDQKNLTLAISDNGIGIPQVLRNTFKETGKRKMLATSSDADLIKYFTEPNIIVDSRLIRFSTEKGTTSSPSHAGVGLYYLKSHVLHEGGELRIRSGKACVDFVADKTNSEDDLLDSPGTLLRIQTPVKLKKAK